MSDDRKPAAKSCRYHCSGCGRHFASEAAFDAHRVGRYDLPRGHDEGRRCISPMVDDLDQDGMPRDRFATEIGVCRIYGAQEGIEINFLAASRESAARAFRGAA